VLYQMAMFPMTVETSNPRKHIFFAFFVNFRIFVLGERTDFKFGTQIDSS